MKLNTAQITRPGGRKENEDYSRYKVAGNYGCFVLADGLGGHQGGALAAKTVGEAVVEAFTASPGGSASALEKYIEEARAAFRRECADNPASKSMKSTLVVLLISGEKALWGHVGDSRLYYFQAGTLKTQTRDHSVPQLLADSGEIKACEIRHHEDRNRLTAAFDGSEKLRFEIMGDPVTVAPGDAFLLCSDGLWEYVSEAEMEQALSRSANPREWLSAMEKLLLNRVEPGHDNYSAVAVHVA